MMESLDGRKLDYMVRFGRSHRPTVRRIPEVDPIGWTGIEIS
jgi:hypothetical protein